ncbi:MAG: hypothetical protein HY692_08140, partial [Cyanobacteria bacterium NC_groundwater_1444_Ag_S-0.65um_54_12]|nr:hypothetical protein [Cyanobacteria bacterium NC_groundwater_1444_Ag_S-0.65um_54_12]
MSKAVLLELAEYRREVDRLYQLIQERRAEVTMNGTARLKEGRVSFREIELGDELLPLLNVEFSTHQEYGGQSVAGVNSELRQKARLVSLAALCELIKNEYQGDFWGLYQEWTGKIADSRIYKSIIEKACQEEGLMRPEEDRRYTDTLIAEAGISRKMLPEVIELFAIYWKYFYPLDIRELFRLIKGSAEEQKRVRILPEEAEKLKVIVERCKEFPTAIAQVIGNLSSLMVALSEREDLQPLDLVERPERFEELCGINPLRVIRGAVALRGLAQRIASTVTPEKFRRIVLTLPIGTRVILPSGRSVGTEEAGDVPYFGRYRIGNANYLVMPNELLPPEDINLYPDHHLSTLGNRVIYKAKDEFLPLEGDAESPIVPRELWIEGRSRGFIWFRNRLFDRAIRVGKQQLYPDEGLHWHTALWRQGDTLAVELLGVRLYDAKLTQKEIDVIVGMSGQAAPPDPTETWFTTDRNGLGDISRALLPISGAAPGEVEISLRNRRTGE